MNYIKLLEKVLERFMGCSLPENFVKLTRMDHYEQPALNIQIGDRDVTVLADGEITGSGSNVGDGVEWRVMRQPLFDMLVAELVVTEELLGACGELLDMIPPCPVHGSRCIPHAIEFVGDVVAFLALAKKEMAGDGR